MIELQRITHFFGKPNKKKSPLLVLKDINLNIEEGKFISFLGPSGCGKTTLLRIVDGLIHPTGGRILIDGNTVTGPSADRAMVFQEFNLLPWRNAQRNTEFGLEVQRARSAERNKLARQALKIVGLESFSGYYPHQLSGGMKQRVGLARALCTAPRLMLMDEPFGALDPQIREIMQVELMKLWESDRKTVIFVTHSVDEAIFLSDRIIIFSARPGTILERIDISLPRPRWENDVQIKTDPRFVKHRGDIWSLLKQEIVKTKL